MSSISLPYEKQIRHFFPFTTVSAVTTPALFIQNATPGQIQLFTENGTTTGKGDIYTLKKDATGKVVKSDLITPKDITYLKGTAPRAKVGKTQKFTLSGVTPGAVVNMTLKIHYGNSEENFEYMFASTKVKATGDTATSVLTRLAKQLGDNLANSIYTNTTISGVDTIIAGTTIRKNKYFTITQVAGALTIAEKNWILDGYYPGLKSFDQMLWNAEIETKNDAQAEQVVKTITTPVYATGQGYQMLELERYFVGHRAEFDGVDQTLGFHRKYEVDVNKSYFCLDLKYFDVSRNDPYQSDKMLTLVCDSAIELDKIGFRIEAFMGANEKEIWNELDPAQNGSDNV